MNPIQDELFNLYWGGERLRAESLLYGVNIKKMHDPEAFQSGVLLSGLSYLLGRSYRVADYKLPAQSIADLPPYAKAADFLSSSKLRLVIQEYPYFYDLYLAWSEYKSRTYANLNIATKSHEIHQRVAALFLLNPHCRLDLIYKTFSRPCFRGLTWSTRLHRRLKSADLYSDTAPLFRSLKNDWDLGAYESVSLTYSRYLCLPGIRVTADFQLRTFSILGDEPRLLALFKRWMRDNNATPSLCSNYIFALLGAERLSRDELQYAVDGIACHSEDSICDSSIEAVSSYVSLPSSVSPTLIEKPRLVVFSPDLHQHPVGRFWLALARHLSSDYYLIHISLAPRTFDDPIALQLKAISSEWHEAGEILSLAELSSLILSREPHILLDLAGHSADNRVNIFQKRLAPLQITYLGFYGPTYAPCCDWWLVDKYVGAYIQNSYPGSEPQWHLPFPSLCYDLSLNEQPLLDNLEFVSSNFPCIGSFNHTRKLTPLFLRQIGHILESIPDASLFLRSHSFQDKAVRRWFIRRLIDCGAHADQLVTLPFAPTGSASLRDYMKVQLHLDSYPVCGTTTTLDSLCMGVPVLTCPTSLYAGSISASILDYLGLENCVVKDQRDLPSRLAYLFQQYKSPESRRSLAALVRSSLICDPMRYSRQFSKQLREMLRTALSRE